MNIENFIGVFPNAVSPEYCDHVVNYFELLCDQRRVFSRQADGVSKINKDGDVFFLNDDDDAQTIPTSAPILKEFYNASATCYSEYANRYGILPSLFKHSISYSTKIQRTQKSGGYHVWHCEQGSRDSGSRLLAVQLFLNDIEDGGETEFLYQSKRVKPVKGTMLISPAGFTHAHRGNPPLSENKYTMNSWIEFIE
jgi:hypothetical protein